MADLYTTQRTARKQLHLLLTGRNAHVSIEDALHGLPSRFRGVRLQNAPYSIWQLADHIRIVQWDFLKFCTNPEHVSPKWPEGYWSKNASPADEEEWQNCIDQILNDRQKFIDLITDQDQDMFEPFETEQEETIFRQALLVSDHTAYHIGQIVLMRRLLNAWP